MGGGARNVGLVDHCKDLVIYSERDGKPLEYLEQMNDMTGLVCFYISGGNKRVDGARLEAGRS